MGNLLGIAQTIFQNLAQNEPKDTLHVGEVMNLWTYLTFLGESNRFIEVAMNTTQDEELLQTLRMSYDNAKEQIVALKKFLIDEGVGLPDLSEHKPASDPNAIPEGIKLSDAEIAHGLTVKVSTSIILCGTGMGQSIRTDVGSIWLHYFLQRVKFSAYLIPLMRRRGWLQIPPAFHTAKVRQH